MQCKARQEDVGHGVVDDAYLKTGTRRLRDRLFGLDLCVASLSTFGAWVRHIGLLYWVLRVYVGTVVAIMMC